KGVAGIVAVGQDRQAAETGYHFAQKFKAFAGGIGAYEPADTGDVAAWTSKARHQAGAERVVRRREDERGGRGSLPRPVGAAARCHNDIDLELDKLGRDFGVKFGTPIGPTIFECDRSALDPTEFAQPLHKGGGPLAPGGS